MSENENMISMVVNADDFCFVCTCAVRYALGRQSYAPSIVISFVQEHMSQMDIRAVSAMIREIEAQDYWGKESYGDKYSKKLWMEFLSNLNARLIQLESQS